MLSSIYACALAHVHVVRGCICQCVFSIPTQLSIIIFEYVVLRAIEIIVSSVYSK